MKKKIIFYLILFLSVTTKNLYSKNVYHTIQPEEISEKKFETKLRYGKSKNFIVVTANDYATKIGYGILEKGGTAADAAVAIQLTLGLVEPQSSGLGGGLFITYLDNKTQKVLSYEGREKAPENLKKNIFLTNKGQPKKFFDAAIGGASVGVPATLKTLHSIHSDHGKLTWQEIIKPVINLSDKGFLPPNRLINALRKEKFLFKIYPDSIFKKIIQDTNKKFLNPEYTLTLKEISKNYNNLYVSQIAKDIVKTVKESENPGKLSLKDLQSYEIEKNNALCYKLDSGYLICGPNLPSSGTVCLIQGLILYEILQQKKNQVSLNEILDILNFVYYLRDSKLADPKFVKINEKDLFDKKKLYGHFSELNKNQKVLKIDNLNQVLSSTSHFSIADTHGNVLSATSSIESSFGSRLFTNGFFLNNQLTDFDFMNEDKKGKLKKNRPQGGKRPLSSMSPLIVFDEKKNFFLSVGSPGGKAIISYVFKTLVDLLFEKQSIKQSIESPNYIRIKNQTFIEDEILNKNLKHKSKKRNLTSGISVIKKENGFYIGGTDPRRDGTVRGK